MFADQNLSKYQRDFRKGFSVQYSLVAMLERWKGAANNKKVFGALLTDLSKEFDCFFHELIIAKLNAYGFSFPALKFIHYYLSNRNYYLSNKELRLIMISLHEKRFYLEYFKVPRLGLYYSISF